MTEDHLERIERKLDHVGSSLSELKSATAEFVVGQATLERRFERMERDWTRIEAAAGEMRNVADTFVRLDTRLARTEESTRQIASRLDAHEHRIAALESSPPRE